MGTIARCMCTTTLPCYHRTAAACRRLPWTSDPMHFVLTGQDSPSPTCRACILSQRRLRTCVACSRTCRLVGATHSRSIQRGNYASNITKGVTKHSRRVTPKCVHLCQLAMKDAVTTFSSAPDTTIVGDEEDLDLDWEDCDASDETFCRILTMNPYQRLTATCRAIHSDLRRSQVRMEIFRNYQQSLGVQEMILNDIRTRFDSTVEMFHSILKNKCVLFRIQERGMRERGVWPAALTLTSDDFDIIDSIVDVLSPVKHATKVLSSEQASVGDVVPTLLFTIEQIKSVSVPERALGNQKELVKRIAERLSMILNTSERLPILGGRNNL